MKRKWESKKEWTTLVANGIIFHRYSINRRGVIYDNQTGSHVKPIKTNSGYRVNLVDEYYASHMVILHRAIYESFSGAIASNQVIHFIDNNSENVNWNNLVAISYSDHNKLHKLDISKRDRTSIPIVLIDLETGEEKCFESVSKCCKHLGNTYNISEVLKGNRGTFGNRRYTARYADESLIPFKWYNIQETLRKI